MQLLKTSSKKGQVTLDSVIGLVVTLLIIGFLVGLALIMNERFKESHDEWSCSPDYEWNDSKCCQDAYPWNGSACWNCTINTTDGTYCQNLASGSAGTDLNGTLTEGSQNTLSKVNISLGKVSTAFSDIAGWMPLIALAMIAVIIIGLMMIFRGAGRRGI